MQYFKHMSNMRHDLKIRRLISKYGLEGYGLYNLILESIVEGITTENPLPDLRETCDDIAEFYNGNAAKIAEIAEFLLKQQLFETDEISGRILCKKIYKYLEQSQTRSEEIRALIESYKNTSKNLLPSQTVSDSPIPSQTNMKEQEQEKEQNKKKNIISDDALVGFDEFWSLYQKKIDRKECLKLWAKIDQSLYMKIFNHVKRYIVSTPDKQYRKNPETYLRGECWNDEIVIPKKNYETEYPEL